MLLQDIVRSVYQKNMVDPQEEAKKVDPATQAVMNRVEQQANQSVDDIAGQSLQGTDYSGLLPKIQESNQLKQQAYGGFGQPQIGLNEALSKRAEKSYSRDMNKMQTQARLQAENEKFNRQKTLSNILTGQQNAALQRTQQQNQALLENTIARNNVIKQGVQQRNQFLGTVVGAGLGASGAAAGQKMQGAAQGAQMGGMIGGFGG